MHPNWNNIYADEEALPHIEPDDLWVYDKLILSKKLGYVCGPVGVDVPYPGHYIVRPTVNFLGMGLGAHKAKITKSSDFLSPGHFWCQEFTGRHISVDFYHGQKRLVVEGFRDEKTFTKWKKWVIIDFEIEFPKVLDSLKHKYPWFCCEFIDGNLIEAHIRRNPDFRYGNSEFVPVWYKDTIELSGKGYSYIPCDGVGDRVGAYIK